MAPLKTVDVDVTAAELLDSLTREILAVLADDGAASQRQGEDDG